MISETLADKKDLDYQITEIMIENFRKVNPGVSLEKFQALTTVGSKYRRKVLNEVHFFRQDLNFEPVPANISLIVYRNKFLILSEEFQNHIFGKLLDILNQEGFIVIGFKENINKSLKIYNTAVIYNEQEKIFRKN
jgi:chemotaxis methyl-accepting protein methylase